MKALLKKIVISILTFQARLVLKKYKPRIVAITGSVGKTSTKDGVYAVLSKKFFVRKSDKSFNSEFGLPLTILNCPSGWNNPLLWLKNIIKGFFLIVLPYPYPQWLVLEVGADNPGDIESVSKWLKTDVVILTAIGDKPVHVEFFESTEHLVQEKAYLIDTLKDDGLLLLNQDDSHVRGMKKKTEREVWMYGFDKGAQVRAKNVRVRYAKNMPDGLTFGFSHKDIETIMDLQHMFGKHHVYVALTAAATGLHLGMSIDDVAGALAQYVSPPGRLRLIEGIKHTMIIDDTYNASPIAVLAGLETVEKLKTKGRKIAVLGDMLELGGMAVEAHREVGEVAGKICTHVFAVGPRARYVVEGALLGGLSEKNIVEFQDSHAAGKHVERMIKQGDIIFVKGSQGIRMEKVVEEIMAHPEEKKKLLVRQEKEWLQR